MFRLAAGRRLSDGMALAKEVLTPESIKSLTVIEQEWKQDRPLSYTVADTTRHNEAREP
jgi:hypothetical protein